MGIRREKIFSGSYFLEYQKLSWFKALSQEEEYISGGDGTWMSIDKLSDMNVSNTILVCSCYCSYNCKHEFAAMLQLRETSDMIEKHYQDEFRLGILRGCSRDIVYVCG